MFRKFEISIKSSSEQIFSEKCRWVPLCLCGRSQKYNCVNNLANYPCSELNYKIENDMLIALYKNVIFMLIDNIGQIILDDKSN